jgi:hypothetical protein
MADQQGALFQGLQALSNAAFPKRCPTCGRVYESPDDFVRASTAPMGHNSGFRGGVDDNDRSILELYRNCECGSTLMAFFGDRRDTSESGRRRRALFGSLLPLLMQQGLREETAREMLVDVINGRNSVDLDALTSNIAEKAYQDQQEGEAS